MLIVNGALVMLVLSSSFIVTATSALIDLDELSKTFPILGSFVESLGPRWKQFIEGVLPTVVPTAWTSSLPTVLLVLSQLQGLETQSWIEMSLLSKYFFYQVWNILFILTVAKGIWQSVLDYIKQGAVALIIALGESIPRASSQQINYVMLQATAVYPAQLLLVGPLVLTWFTRHAPWSRSTPRLESDAYYPSILTSINYGVAYPVPLLVFYIGLLYAPMAPLILPFCALFFVIAFFIYKVGEGVAVAVTAGLEEGDVMMIGPEKTLVDIDIPPILLSSQYMLMYVNTPRYESGGMHAPMIIRRLLAGIFMMQLTMMSTLALKSGPVPTPETAFIEWGGYVKMIAGVSPLLLITGMVYWWMRHGYEELVRNIPLSVTASVMKELERDGEVPEANGRVPVRAGAADAGAEILGGKELGVVGAVRREDRGEASGSTTTTAVPSPSRSDLSAGLESPDLYDNPDATPASFRPTASTPLLLDLDDSGPTPHLEPPTTRVPGILDAPFGAATSEIPEGDEGDLFLRDAFGGADDDLQLHTYVHPALIGWLPVAWIPGAVQPRRLVEARAEQAMAQRELYRRIVGRQRVGVSAIEDGDSGSGRVGRPGRRPDGRFTKIRSFIDNLSNSVISLSGG
ncbi:hypothetical protein BDK51DRAFT_50751 [Blyttiomyces helicus]|uniref:CSC1/OSCA1-like 7TM region domain-containing protein n=1 Tax=Blyttiomyces helicus TaxID=388810 RepID=A0A4P9W091_9FUNG|nr:hypothetical protein BDK51DRAFT_50751 [Blyttiomyces helicus]|eukprot:RKO85484.1 hypothetical protein BDK51DRAFT_50751 [Blyttiomyces helicus]